MESEEIMILRDLPVNTRNYTIIDNITGKPIEQSTYSLTIDKEVVSKLNNLKRINEEKIKQAALKNQYSDSMLVSTFTPKDNNVFTPVYDDDYIDIQDYKSQIKEEKVEEIVEDKEEEKVEEIQPTVEVLESESVLSRVVARDPSTIPVEEPEPEEPAEPLDYLTADDLKGDNVNVPSEDSSVDNSVFTPEMAGLQQASEQIVKIEHEKLGPEIKAVKEPKRGTERIDLNKVEIKQGKGIAWMAYILFFIPLLFKKKNRFVRLHANEGLELNIVEILGAALLLPYFLIESATGTLHTILLAMALLGGVLVAACAITIIPMMICAICGLQVQTPWLGRRRIIHVSTTRED